MSCLKGDGSFMESQILSEVYAEVQRLFSGIGDLAHGWEHVSRVYTMAVQLAQQVGADQFIVGMAALLHDLGHTAEHDEAEDHADLSVKLAGELLDSYQVSPEQREAI